MQSTSNIVTLLRFVRVILAKKSGHHTPPSCHVQLFGGSKPQVYTAPSQKEKRLCASAKRVSVLGILRDLVGDHAETFVIGFTLIVGFAFRLHSLLIGFISFFGLRLRLKV